jgi:hypothetical protein
MDLRMVDVGGGEVREDLEKILRRFCDGHHDDDG